MELFVLMGGESDTVEEQLRRIFSTAGQVRLIRVSKKEDLIRQLSMTGAYLAVLPLEWSELYCQMRDQASTIRIVAYSEQDGQYTDAILQGADNYFPLSASEAYCARILAFEQKTAVQNWRRNASFFAREKARNQLMYARIKDSFENVTLEMIDQTFCFQFKKGLFRAILLRVDYKSEAQNPFDWFHTFDGTIVVEALEHLRRFCFDVYVEFRMNGPMFYCNYAKEQDDRLFSQLEKLCTEVLQKASVGGELRLTLQVGRAYENLQSLQTSREEVYHASLPYLNHKSCKILLFGKSEYANLWQNKRLTWIYDQLCTAGAKLDAALLDESVEELRWMNMEQMRSLFAKYEKDFFAMNGAVIETYANVDHVRKKVVQAMNFANSKESLIHTFLTQYHAVIEDILRVAPRGVRVIHMAKQYVADNYACRISITDAAEKVCLNPSYFSHLFAKETGQHFSDYLMEFRIQKAKELLMSTNLSVGEIAEKVGYSDQRYFSRIFRRLTEMNPTDFRKAVPNKDLKS